jgi:hypothetical protein
MMRPVTASSAPARVAFIALVVAAVTSCERDSRGQPGARGGHRLGEWPGRWYIDVKA